MIIARLHNGFELVLEYITMALVVALAIVVILGVVFRFAGDSLAWYDEVASVMLAWVTYYGAALAALKRGHISVPNLVSALPRPARLVLVVVSELCTLTFFVLLAWYGLKVLGLLAGSTLVSVAIPIEITQSAIPIGATLFIIAELLTLPQVFKKAYFGKEPETDQGGGSQE